MVYKKAGPWWTLFLLWWLEVEKLTTRLQWKQLKKCKGYIGNLIFPYFRDNTAQLLHHVLSNPFLPLVGLLVRQLPSLCSFLLKKRRWKKKREEEGEKTSSNSRSRSSRNKWYLTSLSSLFLFPGTSTVLFFSFSAMQLNLISLSLSLSLSLSPVC